MQILAIIMTILVLGLALPGQADDLSPAEICIAMIPQIIHFALAFFILAAFWGAHHRTFSLVTKLDPFLIRLTFILLFVACLIPFTSTLAGDNHTEGPAFCYSIRISYCSVCSFIDTGCTELSLLPMRCSDKSFVSAWYQVSTSVL